MNGKSASLETRSFRTQLCESPPFLLTKRNRMQGSKQSHSCCEDNLAESTIRIVRDQGTISSPACCNTFIEAISFSNLFSIKNNFQGQSIPFYTLAYYVL
jgi:hypothetical protein